MKLKNIIGHFCLITKHRWVVFKLCLKIGEPWRGLMHDLSKYSPIEFWEGVKYFNGGHSPITDCKKSEGYSKAWLHHRGRNKHHADYWVDLGATEKTPIIPYKYAAEMICDKLAAGIIYKGKDWEQGYELEYWQNESKKALINPQIAKFITEVFTQVSKYGINDVLNKKNIRGLYKKYCIDYEEKNKIVDKI